MMALDLILRSHYAFLLDQLLPRAATQHPWQLKWTNDSHARLSSTLFRYLFSNFCATRTSSCRHGAGFQKFPLIWGYVAFAVLKTPHPARKVKATCWDNARVLRG